MTFELVKKGSHLIANNPMDVSVVKSGFALGSDITKFFGEKSSAEIHLDIDGKRVGFKPTDDILSGFKLSKGGRSWNLSAGATSKRIPLGKYPARIEGDMVVFDVLEIAIAKTSD